MLDCEDPEEKRVFLTPIKQNFAMLDYPSLLAVSTVAREGSFERAAHRLGMTSSAVSQRVRSLEERLGHTLLIRGTPCTLTPLGQTLATHLERVRLLEADLPALPHTARHAEAPPLALRVAVNSDSMASWFPQAMTHVAQEHNLTLDIHLDDEHHTARHLREGRVMAAISADPSPVPGCHATPLGQITYVACAHPAFITRNFPSGVTADSLRRSPVLRFDQHDVFQEKWAKATYNVSLAQAPTHWIPSAQGFYDLTLAGLAWALHPSYLVEAALQREKLIELPPYYRPTVPLYWVVPRLYAPQLRPLTQAVCQAARDHLTPV